MPRRKSYPVPAVPLAKLQRYLRLAKSAAWDLSQSPWLHNIKEVQQDFRKMFSDLAQMEIIAAANTQPVINVQKGKKS